MMAQNNLLIDIHVITRKFQEAMTETTRRLNEFAKVFDDRDRWYVANEGQWPDRFVLLNRFVRTGKRPPYIFNG
jgi:hypothetical protein